MAKKEEAMVPEGVEISLPQSVSLPPVRRNLYPLLARARPCLLMITPGEETYYLAFVPHGRNPREGTIVDGTAILDQVAGGTTLDDFSNLVANRWSQGDKTAYGRDEPDY